MHPREDDIHAYIENALDASARADVERHLQDCADCKQLVADLAEIRQVASSLDLREPPARVWLRIERAIELERRAERGGVSGASRTTMSPEMLEMLTRPSGLTRTLREKRSL